ncbi:hypothetical protein GCM10023339_20270 [Alloalcanivorax gelatiniphagus]
MNDLNNKNCIKSYRELLKGKGGIYSLKKIVNGNQYIGSAKDFYLRFSEQHPKSLIPSIIPPPGGGITDKGDKGYG